MLHAHIAVAALLLGVRRTLVAVAGVAVNVAIALSALPQPGARTPRSILRAIIGLDNVEHSRSGVHSSQQGLSTAKRRRQALEFETAVQGERICASRTGSSVQYLHWRRGHPGRRRSA